MVRQIEVVRALERSSISRPPSDDRDTRYVRISSSVRADDVPDAALEHEPDGSTSALDDAAAFAAAIAHQDRAVSQTAVGQRSRGAGRFSAPGTSPTRRGGSARRRGGAGPELGRQRGHDLQPGRGDHRPEAQLRGRPGQPRQEHRLGLVRRSARSAGSGSRRRGGRRRADRAPRRSARRPRERLDVAVDRPDRDLELVRQLAGRHPAAGLEQQEDVTRRLARIASRYSDYMTVSDMV